VAGQRGSIEDGYQVFYSKRQAETRKEETK
jgi:hypothetical protein